MGFRPSLLWAYIPGTFLAFLHVLRQELGSSLPSGLFVAEGEEESLRLGGSGHPLGGRDLLGTDVRGPFLVQPQLYRLEKGIGTVQLAKKIRSRSGTAKNFITFLVPTT